MLFEVQQETDKGSNVVGCSNLGMIRDTQKWTCAFASKAFYLCRLRIVNRNFFFVLVVHWILLVKGTALGFVDEWY